MKFSALAIFSLMGLSLAAPTPQAPTTSCARMATQAQDQLRNVAPMLQRTVNAASNMDTSDAETYRTAATDALSAVNAAVGSQSEQFRSELTQNCGADANANSKRELIELAIRQNAPLVSQVYGSLAQVYRQTPAGGHSTGGLDGALDGLLGELGDLIEELLKAVERLLENLGLGGLLDGVLGALNL
ncbi:uncharacterized protein BDV14DRAFT_171178 [Aspergillus stella-maris]|uniref:uncharacterized protein n=1 Tax=Aspergillus stella-maris TaxID=1810926 RepID=UPI003CCCD1C5